MRANVTRHMPLKSTMCHLCLGKKWGVRKLQCFADAKYLDESSASSMQGAQSFDTEESGDFYMGRTSPISSIGQYDSDCREDEPTGWVRVVLGGSRQCRCCTLLLTRAPLMEKAIYM